MTDTTTLYQEKTAKLKWIPRKMIVYDRKTGSFACYMSGTYYQHAGSYHEGEQLLNDLARAILTTPERYPQFCDLEPIAQPEEQPKEQAHVQSCLF